MIRFFVRRPLFTLVVFTVLFILGIISFRNLPLDFLPEITLPTLTIITAYPGAGAEDVETTVTKIIEDAVSTVTNIDKITSKSMENLSTITISFKWGANLDASSNDVRDKIDLIRSKLPQDAQTPTILKFDTSMMPVLVYGISARQSYSDLYNIVDKKIVYELKRQKGVGSCTISGGEKRQINVELNRDALLSRNLSINQVVYSIQSSNLNLPAGSIKLGTLGISIRTPSEYLSPDEIAETVISNFHGKMVYLKDVGKVKWGFEEKNSITHVGGESGLALSIQKESGANTMAVAEEIKAVIEKIKPRLPRDIKFTIVMDSSEMIRLSIENLYSTLRWAFLFVVLVVVFFLRDFIGSLIITLSIPFSLIVAFIYLNFSGSSINMLSLSSLAIAIGMVVDDAIVVLDNIFKHRDQKGESSREAAITGCEEVASAVTASTITNFGIFVPLLLLQGFISIFFKQLAYTISIVLLASLFTSLTLTPMLAGRLLSIKKKNKPHPFLDRFFNLSEKWFSDLENWYKGILEKSLHNRRQIVFLGAAFFLISLPLFIIVGKELFPDMDMGSISITVQMPVGTHWEESARIMERAEKTIKEEVSELRYLMVQAGGGGASTSIISLGTKSGANIGTITGRLVPKKERKRSTKEIQNFISKEIMKIPGVKLIDVSEGHGPSQVMGITKPVAIEIFGYDIKETDALAEKIQGILEKTKGVVNPTISRDKGNPEFWVKIDKDKAASLGLQASDIAMVLRSNFYGVTAGKFRQGGDEYDIFVRLKEEHRQSLEDLGNVFIPTRSGQNILISNLATIEKHEGPLTIQRKNQNRVVMVEGNLYNRALGDVLADLKKEMLKLSYPKDIVVQMGGSAEQMGKTFSDLVQMLFLGIILTYLVMAAQFESLLDPFIIMMSVPFGAAGLIWTLFLSGTTLGIMPFVGLIMVVGIVVKNAIVLIDFTNLLRSQGMELFSAVETAGQSRLRPILMTTLTTLLALVPLMLETGEGGEMWVPLAKAVIGGLLVSTVITLIFVPVVYSLFEEKFPRHEIIR